MVVFLSTADRQPFCEQIFHAVRFDIDTRASQASFATTTRSPHGDRDPDVLARHTPRRVV